MKKLPFFLPFAGCPGRCVYCNQNKITGTLEIPDPQFIKNKLSQLSEPREICFFGGSFLRFPFQTVKNYLDAVKSAAPKGSKIRFSTYPNDLNDADICSMLKEYDISTIELGVQSLDERVLAACKRDITPESIMQGIKNAASNGFSLGIQLMIGLPCQTRQSSLSDLQKLAQLMGKNVWDLRLYPCLVIEDTELAKMYVDGTYNPLNLDETISVGGEILFQAQKLGFNIIRVGLQETETLARSVIAGPHHPALGELIMSDALVRQLLSKNKTGSWQVPKNMLSKFSGHDNYGYKLLAKTTGISLDEVKKLVQFV